jgi:hypothetical protein
MAMPGKQFGRLSLFPSTTPPYPYISQGNQPSGLSSLLVRPRKSIKDFSLIDLRSKIRTQYPLKEYN